MDAIACCVSTLGYFCVYIEEHTHMNICIYIYVISCILWQSLRSIFGYQFSHARHVLYKYKHFIRDLLGCTCHWSFIGGSCLIVALNDAFENYKKWDPFKYNDSFQNLWEYRYRVLHTLDVAADNCLTGDFRLARPHWNNMARLSCHAKYPNPMQMYGWVICFEINCTWKQMSHRVMFAYGCWPEI